MEANESANSTNAVCAVNTCDGNLDSQVDCNGECNGPAVVGANGNCCESSSFLDQKGSATGPQSQRR